MRLPFQSKPKTLVDRAEAVAGDAVEFARSVPERLDGPRERALAAAGAVAGVAAGLAFWRSRSDQDSSVHDDQAAGPRTPWKTPIPAQKPPETGRTGAEDGAEAAAAVAPTRSK